MSEPVQEAGLIGPNAILQLLPVLDHTVGREERTRLIENAGVSALPDGTVMIPEDHAARLHQQMRQDMSEHAPALALNSGLATADYILAHRIPKPARALLRVMPAAFAARLLSKAILRHAWTFAGSGQFRVLDPWNFEISHNPLIRGEISEECLCHWHVGVFSRLYQVLVAADCACVELGCGAQRGHDICRFQLYRTGLAPSGHRAVLDPLDEVIADQHQ